MTGHDSATQPPPPPGGERVSVGVVVAPHGRDGRVSVTPSASDPDRFRPGARLYAAGRELAVERAQQAPGGRVLLKLAGVDDRAQAEALRGAAVEVDARDLPPAPPDSYYHYQLLGMTVADASGAELGSLAEIVPAGGANDVYVVAAEGRELLLPAIADVILDVDVAAARMTVAVPEGLDWRPLPARKPPRPRRRRPR